ncbi:MAG: alpha/beta hydrolase, partial [Anaerovibrio sp.]|uniref:alpha/beta hydrolase n=1 Tax=Anaerovibrio sp. TaxID=1872532 RepID=UPI001B23B1F6
MKNKRLIASIIVGLIAIIMVLGYAIGTYFVNFALKRGNDTDPLAPPAACLNIHDKNRTIPAQSKYKNEEWTATSSDGRHLAATHYIPDNPGSRWAILVHGYGRDQRYTGDYAEVYLEHGYQVLTPDLCASGKSEGQYITMGVKEGEEIAVWANKIKAQYPDAQIVLHGVSMGAATVLMAAARDDITGIAAVIEDCGYTSAYEMFSNQLGVIFDLPEYPIMPCVDVVSGLKTGV